MYKKMGALLEFIIELYGIFVKNYYSIITKNLRRIKQNFFPGLYALLKKVPRFLGGLFAFPNPQILLLN